MYAFMDIGAISSPIKEAGNLFAPSTHCTILVMPTTVLFLPFEIDDKFLESSFPFVPNFPDLHILVYVVVNLVHFLLEPSAVSGQPLVPQPPGVNM